MSVKQQINFKANSKLQAFSKKIYEELNAIFSSTYGSSDLERQESIQVLSEYLKLSKDPDDMKMRVKNLKDKIQQIKERSEYKQKLCVLIKDKYWERTFLPNVTLRKFRVEENL